MARIISELSEFSFFAKSFILQVYDVLARHRITLQAWARARSQAQRVVQRAQIILLAADGVESQEIAQ